MARTAVTLNSLNRSTSATLTNTTADPTNDHVLTPGNTDKTLLIFRNTNGSDRVATVKAGDTGVSLRAPIGDLDITVPATTGERVVVLESARFTQADGTINIDLATSFAGSVTAIELP